VKKFKIIGFTTLALAATSAHAGLGSQIASLASLAAMVQGPALEVKLRPLALTDKSIASPSILMTPKLPSGMFDSAPNEGHAPVLGAWMGARIDIPKAIPTESKGSVIPPSSTGASTGAIALTPSPSDAIVFRPLEMLIGRAMPIFETLLLTPFESRPTIAGTTIPALPAVERKGTKPVDKPGAEAQFTSNEAKPPSLGDVATQGGSPVVISDPKIQALNQTKVSIVANNVDLSRVLSILSDQTKANLVLLVPTDTKLTVRLQGVRFVDALNHICTLSGLDFVTARGAYILGPAEKLKSGYPVEWTAQHPNDPIAKPTVPDPPVVPVTTQKEPEKEEVIARTVSTSYIDGQSLVESIKALLGESALQVATGPSQLSPSIVDRDTQQATGVAQGVIQNDGRPVSRTIILRGPKSLVEDAMRIAKDLDQPRPQVGISVTIHDITDSALKELGVTWELGGFTINETPSAGNGVSVGRITRTGTNFTAALKGLEQVDKAKLLASPSVRVMDRERAFVLIGSRLKFPVVSSYSSTGNPIVTTQEEKVGVYLQVAPQIATDGSITLTLYPQVSTIVSFAQIAGGSYPQIDSREAQTTLRVKSGETIVIGGLYKDEELSKISQVPILAQIPLIGELFKNRRKTKSASQVIITLAIELVNPE
jgi:type II secretory pathway component GspD/PulD (secretin)